MSRTIWNSFSGNSNASLSIISSFKVYDTHNITFQSSVQYGGSLCPAWSSACDCESSHDPYAHSWYLCMVCLLVSRPNDNVRILAVPNSRQFLRSLLHFYRQKWFAVCLQVKQVILAFFNGGHMRTEEPYILHFGRDLRGNLVLRSNCWSWNESAADDFDHCLYWKPQVKSICRCQSAWNRHVWTGNFVFD